jgi:hypothetical protein
MNGRPAADTATGPAPFKPGSARVCCRQPRKRCHRNTVQLLDGIVESRIFSREAPLRIGHCRTILVDLSPHPVLSRVADIDPSVEATKEASAAGMGLRYHDIVYTHE